MNTTPVYYQTGTYAREHDELEAYRASHKALRECRQAIDEAIKENFDGMHLSKKALEAVAQQFAPDIIRVVLATTLRKKQYDGRFSAINRAMAMAVPLPGKDPDAFSDPLDMLVCSTHPAILDGFFTAFIRSGN